MLQEARPIAAGEVWYQIAAAEVDSPRYRKEYDLRMGHMAARRLRERVVDSWNPRDGEGAKACLWAYRSGYLAPLFACEPVWSRGSVRVSDLAEVRVIAHQPFLAIAPARRLLDFVKALDGGQDTPGDDFGRSYRRARLKFDPERMHGLPVLVAQTQGGPYVEVEGLTRMCCLLSKHLAGEPIPNEIEVVAGISPRMNEWRPWF